jgi:hypothetical protein
VRAVRLVRALPEGVVRRLSDEDILLSLLMVALQADDSELRADILEEAKAHGRSDLISRARTLLEEASDDDDTYGGADTIPPDDPDPDDWADAGDIT